MWLLNYVTKNSISSPKTEQGSVRGASDGKVQVNASSDFRQLPIVAPYGIAYVPPAGETSVVMPVGGEDMCAGVVAPCKNLNPGELMLYSSGGASIVLKNDGSVYINGKKYS
jgi:phage gp45-like